MVPSQMLKQNRTILDRGCPLAIAISQLASQLDIDDYHNLKRMSTISNQHALGQLLYSAARKGILRDVEFIVPIAIGNGMHQQINDAFCTAAQNCHVGVMKYLLKNGADVGYSNQLALRRAVMAGHPESVIFLLKKGANIHANNEAVGQLAMDCCRAGDYAEVLTVLIENGIDIFKHYQKIYDCCMELKRVNCAQILIRHSSAKPLITMSSGSAFDEEEEEIQAMISQSDYENEDGSYDDGDDCPDDEYDCAYSDCQNDGLDDDCPDDDPEEEYCDSDCKENVKPEGFDAAARYDQ